MYLPKEQPEYIEVPKFQFIVINGKGNPNEEPFAEAVGVLYSLSYTIKMMPKKNILIQNYFDYTVYPLEGLWDLTEEGKQKEEMDKRDLIYQVMIRQPEFVTKEIFQTALEMTAKKKPHPLLNEVIFTSIEDGPSVQTMHVGSYDSEPRSFAFMDDYCAQHDLQRIGKNHREIYLSDARKTKSEQLKTMLRYFVKKK